LRVLAFIKDNKEVLATSGSLLTALFGAIAWAFAYFATQEQVSRLECTMSYNLLLQSLPTEINLDILKIEQKRVELVRIRGLPQSEEQTVLTLNMEAEVQNLESEKAGYIKSYNDVLAKLRNSTCLKNTKEKSP
jgi:hypothetical protein